MSSATASKLSGEYENNGPPTLRAVPEHPVNAAYFVKRRASAAGDELPLLGIIGADVRRMGLDAIIEGRHPQFPSVVFADGVLGDRWHVVVVGRIPELPLLAIEVLKHIGVQQVISVIKADADFDDYVASLNVSDYMGDLIDFCDVGVAGSTTQSICLRLKPALQSAAREHGIDLVPHSMRPLFDSRAISERELAASYGLCYAVFEILCNQCEDAENVVIAELLRDIPGRISPLGSCNCRSYFLL